MVSLPQCCTNSYVDFCLLLHICLYIVVWYNLCWRWAMGNRYKGYTPAQNEAQKRYMQGKIAIRTIVSQEERDTIQAAADAAGQSLNAYTRQAIAERMERDRIQDGETAGE